MTEKYLMQKLRAYFKDLPTTSELRKYLKDNDIEVENLKKIAIRLEDSMFRKRRSKINGYTNEQLQEMYNTMRAYDMAKKLGVKTHTLQQYLNIHGIMKPKRITKEKLTELYRMYIDKEIAEMYGVSEQYIYQLRDKYKLKKYKVTLDYKRMWKELKEYSEFVNQNLYKKMIEMESV